MDGVNEAGLEVWAASRQAIERERSRKSFTAEVLCSQSRKRRINMCEQAERGVFYPRLNLRDMSHISPADPLHNSRHCCCPVKSSGINEPLAEFALDAASSCPTWDRKGLETGSPQDSATASRLEPGQVPEDTCCPPCSIPAGDGVII